MTFYPNGVVVGGFTEADINIAKAAANTNGTVLFPAGTYEVSSLKQDVPGWQDWVFQDGAKLVRSTVTTNPIVEVVQGSHLNIIGGEFDGNRYQNTSLQHGIIVRDGCSLKMSGGFSVKGVTQVGIWGRDGKWEIKDGTVSDTAYWGIYWAAVSLSGSQRRTAPKIQGVTIDRTMTTIRSGMGGGICINGGPTDVIKECRNADLNDNTILLPVCSTVTLRDLAYDAVAIEANYCYMPIMTRNRVDGGRIGISTQTCPWAIQSLNQGMRVGDYLVEMVNCEFGSAVGNMGTGTGASIAHFGISVSGSLSKGLNIVGNNTKMLFGASVNVAPGAAGGSYPHVITGNC